MSGGVRYCFFVIQCVIGDFNYRDQVSVPFFLLYLYILIFDRPD